MSTATVLAVASTSSPGTSYRVWVDATGPIFCDCPGHKYARHGVRKPCKHMRAVQDSTVLPTAVAIASGTEPERVVVDQRFRFLELVEGDIEGGWTPVTDLQRFNNLEVF